MQVYTYLFFLRKIWFHVLETRIHVIYAFSLPKVEFMHPVSLLRVPEKSWLRYLLSPLPFLLFSLKPTLIRLLLPVPSALVKIFDLLFEKSSNQFSAHILLDLSQVFETIFHFLTFGVCSSSYFIAGPS